MTKKELMMKAHKIAREIKAQYPEVDYKFQLGLCLVYLHEEGENEIVELQGSEKQVAWAEKIREAVINLTEITTEKVLPELENDKENLDIFFESVNEGSDIQYTLDDIKEKIQESYRIAISSNSAKTIIETFKDRLNTREVERFYNYEKIKKREKDDFSVVAFWYVDMLIGIYE